MRRVECPDIPSGGASEEHLRHVRRALRLMVEQINMVISEIEMALNKGGMDDGGRAE